METDKTHTADRQKSSQYEYAEIEINSKEGATWSSHGVSGLCFHHV